MVDLQFHLRAVLSEREILFLANTHGITLAKPASAALLKQHAQAARP